MATKTLNFAAASTAGLNNPGTEIITLVKDGSSNFINPPSYDKMRAYLSSGEVPMLFVTDEAGETGSLYQLADYSETENKIRFGNDVNAIEFSAGAAAPVVSEVGGGGAGGAVTTLHINVTAVNRETMEATFTADKTPVEMQEASVTGPIWCVITFAAGVMAAGAVSVGVPPAWDGGSAAFGGDTANVHNDNGNNKTGYVVRRGGPDNWIFDATLFGN